MMNVYYRLMHPPSVWGDYGRILLSGMTSHLLRVDGLLQLERTGPFVPPISFSGLKNIIVTNNFKLQLEHSGLSGFTFQPVIKKHIVLLQWELWDKFAKEPVIYPSTGEPEDYILKNEHSPILAQQMGDIWELCPVQIAGFHEAKTDWFRRENQQCFVSEQAKEWLENRVSEYVTFRPVLD